MAATVNVEELLPQVEPYIQSSARHASDYFMRNKIELMEFDGIEMKMTPDMVAILYRTMIKDLISAQRTYCDKYGLMAIVSPQSKADKVVFNIKLGITFFES